MSLFRMTSGHKVQGSNLRVQIVPGGKVWLHQLCICPCMSNIGTHIGTFQFQISHIDQFRLYIGTNKVTSYVATFLTLCNTCTQSCMQYPYVSYNLISPISTSVFTIAKGNYGYNIYKNKDHCLHCPHVKKMAISGSYQSPMYSQKFREHSGCFPYQKVCNNLCSRGRWSYGFSSQVRARGTSRLAC